MAKPLAILSPRGRVPQAKAEKLLRCYAERLAPAEAAKRSGLSTNTVYTQYSRIRWRLIEVGYYRDAALSKDEAGLAQETIEELKSRKGLQPEDVFAHAAEAIEWAEEWPPRDVLRSIRKVIELTGPLDQPMELSQAQAHVVAAYVRYARTKLIHDRVAEKAKSDETRLVFAEKTKAVLEGEWRAYRAAKRSSKSMI